MEGTPSESGPLTRKGHEDQNTEASSTANVHEGFYLELQRVLPHVRKWVEGYIEGTKVRTQWARCTAQVTDWQAYF